MRNSLRALSLLAACALAAPVLAAVKHSRAAQATAASKGQTAHPVIPTPGHPVIPTPGHPLTHTSFTPVRLELFPSEVRLRSRDDVQQLLLTGVAKDGRQLDLTDTMKLRASNPHVVRLLQGGQVAPAADGQAVLVASYGALTVRASVRVVNAAHEEPANFVHDVEPVLSRAGCNQGGCHGKATGQNGFKLSLFGFDSQFDFDAIVKEGRGRRVAPAQPDESLILLKASATLPHGGGKRFEKSSTAYRLLRRWIAQGTPYEQGPRPKLVRLSVVPEERLLGRSARQQVVVTAHYDDDSTRDVTRDALFRSNEEGVAAVNENGLVTTGKLPGEAAVMAGYMGQVAVFRAGIPMGAPAAAFGAFPANNFVDELVGAKLKRLGVPPSPLCTDAEFLRRVSLDLCGRIPEPEEVRIFLADTDPGKRSKLIDRLLEDPDYGSFFAMKWAGILRNTGQYREAAYAFHAWIREAIATNKPYDQFVREIVTAQGEWQENPPTSWFWQFRDGGITELTEDVAQLFMGQRIQCAKCHHHPYEKWGQDDFYGLTGFFTRMGRKIIQEPGYYYVSRKVEDGLRNPRTGKPVEPKVLDGPVLQIEPGQDRRQKLVDWLVEPQNPYFAPTIANRMWAHFMGRGLVDPIDDMRVSNPPTNPELLHALSQDLIEHHFDVKHLIRTIVNSRTYQLSSDPNRYNGPDQQNYARHYPRRLLAEVLFDAVDQLTGVKSQFQGISSSERAIDLPHENFGSYFLDVFGRPKQLSSPCECARDTGANLSQVLHLTNSGELDQKSGSGSGRAAALAKSDAPLPQKIEELYLVAFGRLPDEDEQQKAVDYVASKPKKQQDAFEDLIWTFMNCREFQFNH